MGVPRTSPVVGIMDASYRMTGTSFTGSVRWLGVPSSMFTITINDASSVNILHENLSIPVTAKFRCFPEMEKTVEYAKMMERAGAQILTCHGRIREQRGQNSVCYCFPPTMRDLTFSSQPGTTLTGSSRLVENQGCQRGSRGSCLCEWQRTIP